MAYYIIWHRWHIWHITLSLSPWHNKYCGIYGILYYMAYMAYNIIWHIILCGIYGIYCILLLYYMPYYIIWHIWHICHIILYAIYGIICNITLILYGILYCLTYMAWACLSYNYIGIYAILLLYYMEYYIA